MPDVLVFCLPTVHLTFLNTFVHGRLGKYSDKWQISKSSKKSSQHHSYCDGASFNNGSTLAWLSHTVVQTKITVLHLASATHQSSIVLFFSCPCQTFLSTALMIGRCHFARFCNRYNPHAF